MVCVHRLFQVNPLIFFFHFIRFHVASDCWCWCFFFMVENRDLFLLYFHYFVLNWLIIFQFNFNKNVSTHIGDLFVWLRAKYVLVCAFVCANDVQFLMLFRLEINYFRFVCFVCVCAYVHCETQNIFHRFGYEFI